MPASQSQDFSRRLLRAFAAPAGALIRHPVTTLVLGLGLLMVGVIELLEGLFEEFETAVEHYHGFLLFGLITLLRGLIELVEAAEFFAINETELEAEDAATRPEPPASGSA
jgi:hypothetical protein